MAKKRVEPHYSAAEAVKGCESLRKISAMLIAEVEEETYAATYGGHNVSAVADSLASHNFMSTEAAKHLGI